MLNYAKCLFKKRAGQNLPDVSSYTTFLEHASNYLKATDTLEKLSARSHLMFFIAEYGMNSDACTYYAKEICDKTCVLRDKRLTHLLLTHPVLSNYLLPSQLEAIGSHPDNEEARLLIVRNEDFIRRLNIHKVIKWTIHFNDVWVAEEIMLKPSLTAMLSPPQCLGLLKSFPQYRDLFIISIFAAHETLPWHRKPYWLKHCVDYLIQHDDDFKMHLTSHPTTLVELMMLGAQNPQELLWLCKDFSSLSCRHIEYLYKHHPVHRPSLYALPQFCEYRDPLKAIAQDRTLTGEALINLSIKLFEHKNQAYFPLIEICINRCLTQIRDNSQFVQKEAHSAKIVLLCLKGKYTQAFMWAKRARYLYTDEEWQAYIKQLIAEIKVPDAQEILQELVSYALPENEDEMDIIQRLRALNLKETPKFELEKYYQKQREEAQKSQEHQALKAMHARLKEPQPLMLPKFVRSKSENHLEAYREQLQPEYLYVCSDYENTLTFDKKIDFV